MTAPDLDALAALYEKATPGPLVIWDDDPLAVMDSFHRNARYICKVSGSPSNPVAIAYAALIVAAVNALPALIARVRELEQWQRDMVEKAAAKSLDGYRELAARAAAAENERDEARAAALAMRERCAQACEELSLHYDGRESEASSRVYADLCRGSRNGADACAAAIRALEV